MVSDSEYREYLQRQAADGLAGFGLFRWDGEAWTPPNSAPDSRTAMADMVLAPAGYIRWIDENFGQALICFDHDDDDYLLRIERKD